MEMDKDEDKTIYKAVVNHEEQYSIWPAHRDLPLGWRDAGKTGTKSECLEYIGQGKRVAATLSSLVRNVRSFGT
jgi:uncharacterized protein YbdZ (MbtH family)